MLQRALQSFIPRPRSLLQPSVVLSSCSPHTDSRRTAETSPPCSSNPTELLCSLEISWPGKGTDSSQLLLSAQVLAPGLAERRPNAADECSISGMAGLWLDPGAWLRWKISLYWAPKRIRQQLLLFVHFMNQMVKWVLKHLLMESSHMGKYTQRF